MSALYAPGAHVVICDCEWIVMLSATPHEVKARRVSPACSGGPTERTVEYKAPFFGPDRKEGYRVAWEVFSRLNGEN